MKKLNKFFAILVALAMMATLCVTMVFAEDGDKATTAPISKTLTVPEGTEIPDGAEATFTFTNAKVNGAAPIAGDPSIATQTLPLDEGGTMTTDASKNVDNYAYTISDVLAGKTFARPGVYEWDVEEATFVADDQDPDTEDHLNKDTTKYKMVVKVVYDDQGNLVIDEVIIKQGTDDPDNPGTTNWTEADGLAFDNAYYTTTGNPGVDPDDPTQPDPDEPGVDPNKDDYGLAVDKQVTGTYGDKNTPFEITVNLAMPQIPGADEAKAFIRRADGTNEAVTINEGNNVIALKHGEKLFFTKIAEGTKYTVTETDSRVGPAADQYTASGEVTTATAVTKDEDSATITNVSNQDNITPTGILINNLPYIALALVAIGGLVAYVVVRRRNADEA